MLTNGTMPNTLVEMSTKRLGITTVRDAGGNVLGLISDGDIRRKLQDSRDAMLSMTAGEVMTRGPKTISPDVLAAEALALMQKHSITSVLATDGDGEVMGIIHIHDILKEGIT